MNVMKENIGDAEVHDSAFIFIATEQNGRNINGIFLSV